MFVKNHLLKIFLFSILFIVFISIILIFIFNKINYSDSSIEEIIIPEVEIYDGGLQINASKDSRPVDYFNSKKKSEIIFDDNIHLTQTVKRYMKVKGYVKQNQKIYKNFFRSVIFELIYENKDKKYYFIPLDDFNRFTGFIYFMQVGKYKIYAYLYTEQLGSKNLKIPKEINTTANAGFFVDVIEGIPSDLEYLLPTKNIDCGNKELKALSKELTKECKSNLEKAKAIYEFLVFGKKEKDRMHYNKYKRNFITCREVEYHSAYIASQILLKKRGVCNDFAEVYAAMMRALGFKIKKVWAFTDENKNIGHMWNIIDLTGDEKKWFRVDATWGNSDNKNYKKWAEFYPEFNNDYWNNAFKPYTHSAFNYDIKIEY